MSMLRPLLWLVAALPLVAAVFWASLAAPLPEPVADRTALGEATPLWEFADWREVGREPLHVVPRVLHRAALEVPGATFGSVVWLNVLAALCLVAAGTGLVRRSFPGALPGLPLAFLTFGVLVANPAHGANWLHGERLGVFLPPLALLATASLVLGGGAFAWRGLVALLVAAVAPFLGTSGVLVGVGLAPVLFRRAPRAGSVWATLSLLFAAGGAVVTFHAVPQLGAPGANWLAEVVDQPEAALLALLHATGGAWFDLLPAWSIDEVALGAASWLAPLALWWLGDRSPHARLAAAPFWGCLCFGLGVVVIAAVRYELEPPVGSLQEVVFGRFLIPVGLIGVVAARFGPAALAFGAGVLLTLGAQDWHRGLEDLRLARMRVDAVAFGRTAVDAPAPTLVESPQRLELLQQRGWMPAADSLSVEAIAAFRPYEPRLGDFVGGSAAELRGHVRSSLRLDTVQKVFVLVREPGGTWRVAGSTAPDFAAHGRIVPWTVRLEPAAPDGTEVQAVGCLVWPLRCTSLGPTFVVDGGRVVPRTGT